MTVLSNDIELIPDVAVAPSHGVRIIARKWGLQDDHTVRKRNAQKNHTVSVIISIVHGELGVVVLPGAANIPRCSVNETKQVVQIDRYGARERVDVAPSQRGIDARVVLIKSLSIPIYIADNFVTMTSV